MCLLEQDPNLATKKVLVILAVFLYYCKWKTRDKNSGTFEGKEITTNFLLLAWFLFNPFNYMYCTKGVLFLLLNMYTCM